MKNMSPNTPKQQARELIEELPDNISWKELAYRLEVRADIEEGLSDVEAGRVTANSELRKEFGLPE